MELHFPAANYIANPAPDSARIVDWLGGNGDIKDLLEQTAHLVVVGLGPGFSLTKICTLDEYRHVGGLLATLHTAATLTAMASKGLGETWNPKHDVYSLLDKSITASKLFELAEEGVDRQIFMANAMAFYNALPYHPKVRGSEPRAGALERFSNLGFQVFGNNTVTFKPDDGRLLRLALNAGLTALATAERSLSTSNEALMNQVINGLAEVKTLIALDTEQVNLF